MSQLLLQDNKTGDNRPIIFLPPLRRRGGYTGLTLFVLPSVFLSILPSVTNIFRHTFLSNHASQPPQTWYGASVRGPTFTLTKIMSASYLILVLRLSLFSVHNKYFPWHFSQLPYIKLQTWYGALTRGPTRSVWNSGLPVIYFLFYDLVCFPT